ncbi:MAG: hypothetical protein INR65_13610 [Gluconacetobacter diazotrophicus]|nr:hypothetical protein [Gluconacetobacter diazotrophicus]
MNPKTFVLLLGGLMPAAVAWAGEPVQLDKEFSFGLEQTTPAVPQTAPFEKTPRTEDGMNGSRKTPPGWSLPPGSRRREFNGQPYYYVPLGA